MSDRVCLVDSAYGVYVPQVFAENYDLSDWGISAEDAAILLSGPDHRWYWETWDMVLCDAHCTDENGRVWRLEQDGDLFAWADDEEEEE